MNSLLRLAGDKLSGAHEAAHDYAPGPNGRLGGIATNDRGQTNLVGLFLGLMIAAIIVIQVFIPVVTDAIASSNVSGTTKSILELLPLLGGLLLVVALASPLMQRI